MHIPHACCPLRGLGNIPLDHDCAWGWAFGLEDEVAHFDRASVTWLADLEDRSWRCLIGEGIAGGHDEGPHLTSHLDVLGDFDGRSDHIGTVVEVENLVRGEIVHCFL